ncbi:MAG TPA: hypothetical protein VGB82_16790 [Alphaproteobacteria bacterium]
MRWLSFAIAFLLSAGSALAEDIPAAADEGARPQPQAIIIEPVPQLAKVPESRPPLDFDIAPGKATHRDDQMDPYDPADQQQNQSHGLTTGPWDDIPRR